ncbi:hypothetical protein [Streptomyces mirabilis]|uniref:hypothetical protein n=1 Tax=Streptomyces mirabilis TaxID=68239 RepID=UPI003323A14C
MELAKASGRPSIALTGASLGENADLYVAVDDAGECGHGGDSYTQRRGGRHVARMCDQQSHQRVGEEHQTQFLVVAVLKTGSSEVRSSAGSGVQQ